VILDNNKRVESIFVGRGLSDKRTSTQKKPKEIRNSLLKNLFQVLGEVPNEKKAVIVRKKYIDTSMKSVSEIPVCRNNSILASCGQRVRRSVPNRD